MPLAARRNPGCGSGRERQSAPHASGNLCLPAGRLTSFTALILLAGIGCLSLAARAASAPATTRLLGVVTGIQGRPWGGASVRLRSLSSGPQWRGVSSPSGAFLIAAIPPGVYLLQAAAPGLWASQRIRVRAGEPLLLQLRLRKLRPGQKPAGGLGHYKWLLRETAAQRPILQLRGAHAAAPGRVRRVNGQISMMAGSGGQAFSGSSPLATSFDLNTVLASNLLLGFRGDMDMASGLNPGANASLETDLTPQGAWDGIGHLQFGMRQIAAPLFVASPEMRLYTFEYGNQWQLTRRLSFAYGAAISALAASRTLHQINPYMGLAYRFRHGLKLKYQYVAAPPPAAWDQNGGLELANPAPRLSVWQGRPEMESASHQQVSLTAMLTPTTGLEAAWYHDRFQHAVVNGSWQGGPPQQLTSAGAILPDVYSNLFSANGGAYAGSGELIQLTQQLDGSMKITAGFVAGPTLGVARQTMRSADISSLLKRRSGTSYFVVWSGIMPWSHTRWRCSYATAPVHALTPMAPYAGLNRQPYANMFLRQPLPPVIPGWGGKMDMLLEMQNLLAQGYVPIITQDGQLIYLLQSARSLRGGVSFHF